MLPSIQIEIEECKVLLKDKFLTWSSRYRVIFKERQCKQHRRYHQNNIVIVFCLFRKINMLRPNIPSSVPLLMRPIRYTFYLYK